MRERVSLPGALSGLVADLLAACKWWGSCAFQLSQRCLRIWRRSRDTGCNFQRPPTLNFVLIAIAVENGENLEESDLLPRSFDFSSTQCLMSSRKEKEKNKKRKQEKIMEKKATCSGKEKNR